jgi:hypothetical protein
MRSLCKQLAVRMIVALATFGLAVPMLFATPCACAHKQVEAKKSLPPCCAKRLASQHCTSSPTKPDNCCGGSGPCECPGCKCTLEALDATMAPATVKLASLSTYFVPLAIPATISAISADQISLAAHTEQTLSRYSPVPLRALYCVWII